MKKRITLFCLLAFLYFIPDAVAQCTSAVNGLFPNTTFTPNCSGNYETITNQSWTGEYSNVNVIANKQYSFSSSVTTDFVTITNATGTVTYASGIQPVIWDSGNITGVVRYYMHSNSSCISEQVNRLRYVRCADASNCTPPSNLVVSNITSNSCKLTWTAASPVPSSNYDIYIVTTNTAPNANSTPTLFSTTNLTTSLSLNLAAGTTYYYWIRSNCGATIGAWISGGSFTTPPALICNGAIYGLYPDATFTPACTGSTEQIVTNAYAGEYSNVNVVSNKQYTFTSSVSTDFVTITNATGTAVLASGLTPLTWLSGTNSGVIRYHLNTNSNCGTQNTNRVKSIRCTTPVICGLPSGLFFDPESATTVNIAWSAPTPAPSNGYVYCYSTVNDPFSANAITGNTTNTFAVLTNLSPNTTYYFWVKSNCGSTQSNWASGGSFTTAPASGCNEPMQLFFDPESPTTVNIAWLAPTPVPSNGYVYSYSTVNDPFSANAITGTTTETFAVLNNLTPSTTYYFWVKSNCGYTQTNWVSGGSFTTYSASGCNAPTQFWSENVASTTATLNWIPAVPAPDSYVIRYNTVNQFGGIQDATFTTSLSLDNLNPDTDYYWWIASVCGEEQSQWVFGGFFHTLQSTTSCNTPTNTTVYNLGTTSCIIGWSAPLPAPSSGYEVYLSTNNTTPNANTTPTYVSTSTNVNIAGGLIPATSYYCWVRSNCGAQKSNWSLVLNFVTNGLSGCNAATYGLFPAATFTPVCSGSIETITSTAWAGEYSNVSVTANQQYTFSSSNTNDFITITNDSNSILASGLTPLSWSSGSTSGIIRYYLHTNSNCGSQNTNRIKYMQCTITANCGLPSNLTVSNITSNSCRLFWNAPSPVANSYDIYVSTNNTTPLSTTNPTYTSLANLLGYANGLLASTTYYYWVRSNCNGLYSAWVSGGSFTTNAALSCNGANFGLYPDTTFTPTCSGNFEQITSLAWAGEYSNVNVLSNKKYTFTSSVPTDYITITNASGTTVLASGITPLVWNSTTTTGVVRYFFHTNSNCGSQNTNRIRSIKCENSTSCNTPTQFGSEVLSSTSAVISWIPSTSAPNGGYLFVYNTNPTIGGMDGSTFSTSADLTDLLPNTTYYWWVASNCVTSQSDWAYGGSFTTASECNVPTQLFTDPESATVVNIAWVAPTPEPSNGYMYAYSTVNDPFSANAITGTTIDTFAVLNNLTPNTTYYFWVKSICGNTQTDWVSGGSFTTQFLTAESFSIKNLKLYPNPVNDIVNLSFEPGISSVTIYNVLGQIVISKSIPIQANETSIDVAALTSGTYIVKVYTMNDSKTIKIIKQ